MTVYAPNTRYQSSWSHEKILKLSAPSEYTRSTDQLLITSQSCEPRSSSTLTYAVFSIEADGKLLGTALLCAIRTPHSLSLYITFRASGAHVCSNIVHHHASVTTP